MSAARAPRATDPDREQAEKPLSASQALTDLKIALAKQQQSERDARRLASIVETSEDAIIAKDLEGRIIEWNRSAERVFGYRRDEVIGRSIEILMPPDAADDWRQILGRVVAGQRVEHFETRRRTRDGRILDVSLTVSPLRDEEGRIVGAAKIARDVTAEKAALREREKTRELFLGVLSHDLRNPLNSIRMSAYTLKRDAREADQKALARISNGTERMSRMIDQLLDLTKSRLGGGIPVHRADADLTAICRAVGDEFETLHPGRLLMETDSELKGRWDRDRITQALSNLVSNAFQYGGSDRPVLVRARGVDAAALVEVINHGPEIPAPLLSTIFDPFDRGAVEQHREIRGLGLGLYIAREIARAHEGDITVRSGPVEGTTFSLSLPRLDPASAS